METHVRFNVMKRHFFAIVILLILFINRIECQGYECNPTYLSVPENVDTSTTLSVCAVDDASIEMNIESTAPSSARFIFQQDEQDDTKFNLQFEEGFRPDYEQTQSYTVTVTASGTSVMSQIHIIITDVDDNYPQFAVSTITVSQRENEINPTLTNLTVTDKDSSNTFNAESIDYTFENDYGGTFAWTNISRDSQTNSIMISLQKPLDYEQFISYTLRITAKDGGGLTADATIIVNVEDIEDTIPFFRSQTSYAEIPEDAPKDTFVLQVLAVDGDTGINRPVTYNLTDGNIDNAFKIEKDENTGYGVVKVSGTLDRDEGTALYNLVITATEVSDSEDTVDDDNVQKNNITTTIALTDVDDSPPVFTQNEYTANVPENSPNGFIVTFQDNDQLTVTDADSAENADFEMSLTDDLGIFSISPNEGQTSKTFTIMVDDNSKLDYEKNKNDIITVIATDKNVPTLVSTSTVTIIIEDENDVPPTFTEINCPEFPENVKANAVICEVQAVDHDSAEFATIGYSASFGQLESCLTINSTTGNIYVINNDESNCFDYEISDTYYITIMARDADGTGQLISNNTALHVIDVNDNPPVFQGTVSKVSLTENEEDFTVPLIVQVTDADSGENADITFTLTDGSEYFHITDPTRIDDHTSSATIVPITPLDYESFSECKDQDSCPINVTVNAYDGLNSANVDITVLLMDTNDEEPVFDSATYETDPVREDAKPGTLVYTVQATDADFSVKYSTIAYRLQNDEAANFVIDSNTGVISVSSQAKLDPDLYTPKKLSYNLTVTADDGGLHEDEDNTCFVIVIITDIDNKAPSFDNNGMFSTSIMENTTMDGEPFFTAQATDPDSTASLHYEIDFDKSSAYDYQNKPVPDPNLDVLFSMDPSNGELTIITPVDREIMTTIMLTLVVVDENTEPSDPPYPSTSTGTLTITVNDTNDNIPQFSQSIYPGSVLENAPNAVVSMDEAMISATDADGVYGIVTYSITGSDPEGANVSINSKTATLITGTVGFDYESASIVLVYIQAADNGNPPLTSTAMVNITIINVNEYSPEFNASVYYVNIEEDSLDFVDGDAAVYATDKDAGDYGIVNYKLSSSSQGLQYISIDPSTGVLIVENELDYEKITTFPMTVIAYDNPGGSPSTQKSQSAGIIIDVVPINDETPVITNLPNDNSKWEVSEDCFQYPTEDCTFPIKATDSDLPTGSPDCTLNYLIDDLSGHFVITEASNPEITVASSLLNQDQSYTLLVTVTDDGVNPGPRNSSADVYITIVDVNNNAPTITSPPNGSIPGHINEGDYLTKQTLFDVYWTDTDTTQINRDSTLKIDATCNTESGKGSDVDFTIEDDPGSQSGTVYLQGNLVRTECYEYQLKVTVTNLNTGNEGAQVGSATYYYKIDPENMNLPQFPNGSSPFKATFMEEVDPSDAVPVQLPSPRDPDYIDGVDIPPIINCTIQEDDMAEIFDVIVVNTDTGTQCNLTTKQKLDREIQDSYNFNVIATDVAGSSVDKSEPLLVMVFIDDINDNDPKFNQTTFYGGVSSDTTENAVVCTIGATDADTIADSGKLRYSAGPMQIESQDGSMDDVPPNALHLDEITGEFQLHYSFLDSMQGYMHIPVYVQDSDPSHVDNATVEVYVVSQAQKLVCSSTLSTSEFQVRRENFSQDFSNVLGVNVVVDSIKQHTQDGKQIDGQSDVFIHMVKNEVVMEAKDAIDLIDSHSGEVYDQIFYPYFIYYIGPVVPYTEDDGLGLVVYILIAVCAALVLACILIMGICIYQNTRLSRKLKAATAPAFSSQASGMNRVEVPGTNKHTFEGSNPVWNPAAENKQQFIHNDSNSDESDASIIPNEHFEGGLNNPSYEQRIENIFADANFTNQTSVEDMAEQEQDHINDNFEYRRRSTIDSDIPDFPLSEL